MPVNKYFNHFPKNRTGEQRLIERLVAEAIRIKGEDCYYMPRESWSSEIDYVLGEDAASKFTSAYVIEMYHSTVDSYQGPGDMFTKFGHRQKDSINLEISGLGWRHVMEPTVRLVPREGDLIFVPSQYRIWEIKFVEQNKMFHTLGKVDPYKFELYCELFKYSQEDFDTGVDEIDIIDADIAYTIRMVMINGAGDYQKNETVTSPTGRAKVTEWDYQNNAIKVTNISGFFNANTTLTGATSGSAWTIQTVSDRAKLNKYDNMDNQDIQDTANVIINRTETNPFGIP